MSRPYQEPTPLDPRTRPAEIVALEQYWRQLRGARTLPVRTEIDPNRIDRSLPYSFIGEHMAPGIVRLRVTGQRMNQMVGADARGMPLSTLFSMNARPTLASEIDLVFKAPAVVEIALSHMGDPAREIGRILMLPLEDHTGEATRMMGAIVLQEPVRRLEICASVSTRREILTPLRYPVSDFDDAPKEKGPERRRPALRLVVSND
ncbi:MAG TPA: PAS domain-containing protein [Paracoccaceae bacterium]|nr:PAS domain-containing protein [Paracoccaceae bacterium]